MVDIANDMHLNIPFQFYYENSIRHTIVAKRTIRRNKK